MYWKNSNFQIANFVAGKCFTADEAYRVLMELQVDRQLALDEYVAYELETSYELSRLDPHSENGQIKARYLRLKSQYDHAKKCNDQALLEIEFIKDLINQVQHARQFKHLPDEEAFQACQRLEWKLKLDHKAKISLMTNGQLPPDLLETIMAHPDSEELTQRIKMYVDRPDQILIDRPEVRTLLLGE